MKSLEERIRQQEDQQRAAQKQVPPTYAPTHILLPAFFYMLLFIFDCFCMRCGVVGRSFFFQFARAVWCVKGGCCICILGAPIYITFVSYPHSHAHINHLKAMELKEQEIEKMKEQRKQVEELQKDCSQQQTKAKEQLKCVEQKQTHMDRVLALGSLLQRLQHKQIAFQRFFFVFSFVLFHFFRFRGILSFFLSLFFPPFFCPLSINRKVASST